MSESVALDHRHRWKPTASIVAASGFESFHKRVEGAIGFRLPHPGYLLFECNCGAKGIRDYCTPNPIHVIGDEAYEVLT